MLELAGCNVVLGVQWLEILRPRTWDFFKLSIKFLNGDKWVELKGLKLKQSTIEDSQKVVKASITNEKRILL